MKKKIKKQKAAPVQPQAALNRNALMMKAKEQGIKNFRVLNKSELEAVLAEGVTPEQIEKVVSGAVARWKSGWGSKKAKS